MQEMVQPPSEKSVLRAADRKLYACRQAKSTLALTSHLSLMLWRYYPFIGTEAFAKGVMGPAFAEGTRTLRLDHQGVKTAIDNIFSKVADLNTCGLDGFPQYIESAMI